MIEPITSEAVKKTVFCVYQARLLTSQTGLFSVEIIKFGWLKIYDIQLVRSEMVEVGMEVNVFVGGSSIPRNFHTSVCQRNFLAAGKRISVFRKRNTEIFKVLWYGFPPCASEYKWSNGIPLHRGNMRLQHLWPCRGTEGNFQEHVTRTECNQILQTVMRWFEGHSVCTRIQGEFNENCWFLCLWGVEFKVNLTRIADSCACGVSNSRWI
jgi:hypothetical protein